MSEAKYIDQVRLLLDVLPDVATEPCFAVHGGTAINLFVRDMPRLSVDIDLTYLPIEDRATTLGNIAAALNAVQKRIAARMRDVHITHSADRSKLLVSRPDAAIKIEVNTVMRGCLGEPVLMALHEKTQEVFDRFVEMRILPIGQLYGGKICAALDRQHPRDLFDIKYMFESEGFSAEIKRGFLLCLLCSDRPIHELLRPNLSDQRDTLVNHFAGMTERPFSYDEYEATRSTLIETINADMVDAERRLLITFSDGAPAWAECDSGEFDKLPGVQWKLQNIRNLKIRNPTKHRRQLDELAEVLERPGPKQRP